MPTEPSELSEPQETTPVPLVWRALEAVLQFSTPLTVRLLVVRLVW